jgi:hypothetical protein
MKRAPKANWLQAILFMVLLAFLYPNPTAAENAYIRQTLSWGHVRFLANSVLPTQLSEPNDPAVVLSGLAFSESSTDTTAPIWALFTRDRTGPPTWAFSKVRDIESAAAVASGFRAGWCAVAQGSARIEGTVVVLDAQRVVELSRSSTGDVRRVSYQKGDNIPDSFAKTILASPFESLDFGSVIIPNIRGKNIPLTLGIRFLHGGAYCQLSPATAPVDLKTADGDALAQLADKRNAVAISIPMIKYVLDSAYEGKKWPVFAGDNKLLVDHLEIAQGSSSSSIELKGHLLLDNLKAAAAAKIENASDTNKATVKEISLAPELENCDTGNSLQRAACSTRNALVIAAVDARQRQWRDLYVNKPFNPFPVDNNGFPLAVHGTQFLLGIVCESGLVANDELIFFGNYAITKKK